MTLGLVKEGDAFGRSDPTVLWARWASKRTAGWRVSLSVSTREVSFADCLASLLTRKCGFHDKKAEGRATGIPPEISFSNQAGKLLCNKFRTALGREIPNRSGTDGRRLWQTTPGFRDGHHRIRVCCT